MGKRIIDNIRASNSDEVSSIGGNVTLNIIDKLLDNMQTAQNSKNPKDIKKAHKKTMNMYNDVLKNLSGDQNIGEVLKDMGLENGMQDGKMPKLNINKIMKTINKHK